MTPPSPTGVTTVAVVGSTGSIGTQTIDVVRATREQYDVVAIGAHSSVDALVEQAATLRPRVVAVADPAKAAGLERRLPSGVELRAGPDALASISTDADVIVNGVVGFAGLSVTMAALAAGAAWRWPTRSR